MDSSELVLGRIRLRPPNNEALLIRIGWFRYNVEVNVIHELYAGTITQKCETTMVSWGRYPLNQSQSTPDARYVHYSTS
jgi:hypothetical protein